MNIGSFRISVRGDQMRDVGLEFEGDRLSFGKVDGIWIILSSFALPCVFFFFIQIRWYG